MRRFSGAIVAILGAAVSAVGLTSASWPAEAQPARVYRVGILNGPGAMSMRRAIARPAAAVVFLLAAWFSAEAQRPQVARIGIIQSGSPATSAGLVDAFSQRLRELGYVEGRNVTLEVRYADDMRYAAVQPQRYRDLAAEVVGLQVDVIVTSGTLATRAAKDVTSTIPVVMVSAGDAVAAGLVKSLAQPGGNVTGQSFMGPELAVKGFDLLMEAFPRAKRVAALFNPEIGRAGDAVAIRNVGAAAQARGVVLQRVELRRPEDLDRDLATTGKSRPDGLLAFAINAGQLSQVAEFAAKHRLPAVYGFREAVDAGGLMSFGPKLPELCRGAADYVDKILKGASPSSLPVRQPITFELVINLKTAKTLGVTIPPALLGRADLIVQ